METFIRHYEALRANPLTRSATICYIMENNLGKEAEWFKFMITKLCRFDNATVLFERREVTGFRTTADSKLIADDKLQSIVMMEGLSFTEEIISVNPDETRTAADARNMLIQQLADMREYTKKKENGTERRYITSLFAEDGTQIRGKHDDIQRALSMLIDVSQRFYARTLPVDYDVINLLQGRRRVTHEGMEVIQRTLHERAGYVPLGRKRLIDPSAYDDEIEDSVGNDDVSNDRKRRK